MEIKVTRNGPLISDINSLGLNKNISIEKQIRERYPSLYFNSIAFNRSSMEKTYTNIDAFMIYKEKILFPRHFDFRNNFGEIDIDKSSISKKENPHIKEIEIESKISLRNEIQKEACKFLIENESGLLQLPPGKGKTVIAIHALCCMKSKSLIIVDRDDIASQWKDSFLKHTDILQKDITYFVNTKKFNSKINIATIQSLIPFTKTPEKFMKLFKMFYESGIRCVVIDEVHAIIGPEVFTNVLFGLPSERLYGLSATPFRRDGRDSLIQHWLSENSYTNGDFDVPIKIKPIYINGIPNERDKYSVFHHTIFDDRYKKKDGTYNFHRLPKKKYFDVHKYCTKLIKSGTYCKTIAKLVVNVLYKNKIPVVVLSASIKLLKEIRREILILNKKLDPEIGMFMEKAKRTETEKPITLATMSKSAKAIDAPWWSACILATPIHGDSSDLVQAMGRCSRSYTFPDGSNKKAAYIFDCVDMKIKHCVKLFLNRKTTYKSFNFICDPSMDEVNEDTLLKMKDDFKK